MQKTALICNNFSGINRSSSVYSSSVITASDIQNVELYSTEVNSGVGIRTAKGNVSVCDLIPNDEQVINIFESIQRGKSCFFVHTENETEGKIYQYLKETNSLTEKVNGLTVTGVSCGTDVSQGWSDLWVFSNSVEMLSIELDHYNELGNLDEVQMMELTDTEGRIVKGLGLVVYAGRLWVFDGQVLRYSRQEDIYDFSTSSASEATSAGYIEFLKNITAIYPYLGCLAVFHKDSSCIISRNDSDNSFSKTMEFPGGCSGVRALVFHGTELYFYDDTKKGIFCFRQVVNGDKTLGENIAVDIQQELLDISSSMASDVKTLSIVTSDRNEVWFLIPSPDSNYSTILIYDYLRRAWVKRKSQKISCIAMVDGKLYSAGKKIYEEYVGSTFDEEFIEAFYICTPFNLGRENSIKAFGYPPKITLDMYYNNHFYVQYSKNYDDTTKKERYIKSQTKGNYLYFDIGHWDKHYYPLKNINLSKRIPVSYFKALQMVFLTKNDGDDFCIKSIEFEKIKVKSI